MELKRRLNPKLVFVVLYFGAFLAYIIYGLQPADAVRSYSIDGELNIPSISLTSDTTILSLNEGKLDTPDAIVGSYSIYDNKTLLIGHSSGVFHDLHYVKIGDEIIFNNRSYYVSKLEYLQKSDINMRKLLRREEKDTLVVMTCAGKMLKNHDATHRLIITASV